MGHEGLALSASAAPATPAKKNTAALAPGFRFHPTDEELVSYYLKRKVCQKPFRFNAIGEVDIYKNEPWDLAAYSWMKTRDQEWYFFSALDKKYGNGARMNRATGKGYWKATGKDREIRRESQLIGMKKTLVFHSGRAPDGQRTNWVMHEYRLVEEELDKLGAGQDSYVLCRVFHKNNIGPPNGNRYAPFVEEEWDDGTAAFPGEDAADDVVAGEDACIERDDGERTCLERNGSERMRIEWNGGKRFRTERNGCERLRVERNSGERIHIERSGGEKNHIERNGGERNHIERCGGERMRIERNVGERMCIERNGGERMHIEQDSQSINKEPLNINELPRDSQNELLVCKREGIDVCPSLCVLNTQAPLPLLQYKRRKQNDSGCNRSNGSDNSSGPGHDPSSSTTTTAETATMMATNSATTAAISALLEFSLMESIEPRETPRVPQTSMFEADDFDSQMPPSCAKLIKDLKQQVHKVAVERETLKLEMMSAQAMINILHSRVDQLTRENEHLKRRDR